MSPSTEAYPSTSHATIEDYLPERVLGRHSWHDLPEQWVLSRDSVGPGSWPEHSTGGWTLRRHPALPLIGLRDNGATAVGWLLGYPVTEDGVLTRHQGQLTVPAEGRPLREWLDSLGGRWAALLVGAAEPFVSLDACGTLPAVYSAGHQVVAATPHLIPYRPGLEDDVDLVRTVGAPLNHHHGGYPLGLTPRRGVRRLLPNHTLSLRSFDADRHWPRGDVQVRDDVAEQTRDIANLTSRTITALVRSMPCALPLTSGRDSRMLLALAREHAPELHLYTKRLAGPTGVPDWGSLVDARVARDLARRNALRHEVLPIVPATEHDLDEWVFRTAGMISAPRGWRGATTAKAADPVRSRLLGTIGELGRARLWQPDDTPETIITPERLLRSVQIPVTSQTTAEVAAWLERFPTTNAFTTLNLFYLEQTVGCWGAMLTYAEYTGPGFTLFPMNHAGVVRRMCELPWDFQRSGALQETVIRQTWPELMDVPFHRDTGARRALRRSEGLAQGAAGQAALGNTEEAMSAGPRPRAEDRPNG